MLFIVAAAGLLGSVALGFRALVNDSQLDRILALGCIFAAAASILGVLIDDGKRERKTRVLTTDERLQLLVATPLALLMIGVFLMTLIPSIYVLIPAFAVWHYGSRARPPAAQAARPAPEPALAH